MRRLDNKEDKPFNNTIGKLDRINNLWIEAHRNKIEDNIEGYYTVLECLFIEIYPHINKEEKQQLKDKIKKIEQFLDNTQGNKVTILNRRKGSNLCDEMSLELSQLCTSYGLEWLDIKAWKDFQRSKEPIMKG